METVKRLLKRIPPIRRLVEQRNDLARERDALIDERDARSAVGRFPAGALLAPRNTAPPEEFFGRTNVLHAAYPRHASIGRWTYGGLSINAWDEGEPRTHLTVGAFCSIADGVQVFLGGEHRSEWVSTFPFNMWKGGKVKHHPPKSKGDVVIGNDVWIGTEAMIMSGVTIGDGAVIGARAMVAKDVEPYTVVAGNPARVIRKRFSDEVITRLLALKWWDWPDEEIDAMLPLMMDPDIEAFLDAAEKRRGAR